MTYKPRILSAEFPFHITARSNNRESFPIPLDEAWEMFSNYLYFINKVFGLRIHSFVLMPNHLHLIARDPELNLPEAMNYFMRETAKLMGRESGRINKVWGAPYHSSLIGSPLYYLHAYKYVYRNPVRAKLVEDPLDYRYSTLAFLLGLTRGIIPLEPDETLFAGVDESLKWLSTESTLEENQSVRLALRRKQFSLPRSELNKKQNHLEDESSVPALFRKGRAFPNG